MIKIARDAEFNRDQVLRQAMLVFWEKGYEATSIPDLLKAMGLSRSSLYNTFGDKRALFLEALRFYQKQMDSRQEILNRATSVKEGITEYFNQRIESAYSTEHPKGCMTTNTSIELSTPDNQLKELVKNRFLGLENSFYQLLEKGRLSGEIKSTTDTKSLACLFMNLNHSINIMGKVNIDRLHIGQMIKAVINII